MQTMIPLLQNVRVASPCDASWEGMETVDGERVKFCLHCAKNVYNLSELTQSEAEGLLRKHEGRLCVRYYQRRDGTVLTRDCPIGAQAVRIAMIRRSTVAAGLFTLLFGAMAAVSLSADSPAIDAPPQIIKTQPIAGGISIHVDPLPVKPEPPTVIQGDVATEPVMGTMIAPPPPPRLIMGKMRMPEHNNKTVKAVSSPPLEDDNTTAVDTSDESILKPHK